MAHDLHDDLAQLSRHHERTAYMSMSMSLSMSMSMSMSILCYSYSYRISLIEADRYIDRTPVLMDRGI